MIALHNGKLLDQRLAQNHVMTLHTGGSERMRIDASGRVTMPQQPAFWVDQTNSSQGVTSGSSLGGNTVIQFNGSRTNQGNHFANNDSQRLYLACTSFLLTASLTTLAPTWCDVFEMGFVKNNSIRFGHTSLTCANFHSNNEHPMVSATDIQYLAANDYVEVKTTNHRDTSGGTLGIRSFSCSFSGYLIG